MPKSRKKAVSKQTVCLTVCNHWSYIGIGWQLGIETCVLSAVDAMEMADRQPGVRTCINQDARAYEFMAEKYPEITRRLKRYLKAGKVELIGGSYGQPLGTMFSGESNIRQVAVGRELIRRVLGYEMRTFLEQEEFSHPQLPQIVAGTGFKYASLSQMDTWGRAGMPVVKIPCLYWQGLDGTRVPSTARTTAFCFHPTPDRLPIRHPDFAEQKRAGMPLIFAWEEFGWESAEQPAYLERPQVYRKIADTLPTEFVTLEQYMDRYGQRLKTTMRFRMDDWDKLLSWGLGGDQLRVFDRKVETILLAAERFDVVAGRLGAATHEVALEAAWRDLLASQSHDVSLCEYSRWQGDRLAQADGVEDRHSQTWGSIGYAHLDAAQAEGRKVLEKTLRSIAARIKGSAGPDRRRVVVFNAGQWARDGVAVTGRLYPLPAGVRGVEVTDSAGRTVASQVVRSTVDRPGELVMAKVAFLARNVPGVGYDSYQVRYVKRAVKSPSTDLKIRAENFVLENQHLKVRVSPVNGSIVSLVDKASGREMVDATAGGLPTFRGIGDPQAIPAESWKNWFPNQQREQPVVFDTSRERTVMTWMERGPVRATLRARQDGALLKYESWVTLAAGSPYVEVTTRILCHVPPLLDQHDKHWPWFKKAIGNGYWLDFKPAFDVRKVMRDYPLGIEETRRNAFHALTFMDLEGKDGGLLVLHPGTQYFKRQPDGTLRNLLVREWESFFSREYGWPRCCEYRHAFMPHGRRFRHEDCLRAATQFTADLLTTTGEAGLTAGSLPVRQGFLDVKPSGVQLLALRRKVGGGDELRVVECEGKRVKTGLKLNLPVAGACETDLLGRKIADQSLQGGQLRFGIEPWKVRTFELS